MDYSKISIIQIEPPHISFISSSQEDDSQYKQIMFAIRDQFSIADFKNFSEVEIYEERQEKGIKYIVSNQETDQQSLSLYILSFYANSQGKQKYLSKFKKMVLNSKIQIQVPRFAKKEIIQLSKQHKDFFKIIVSKLKHYNQCFSTVQSTVKFFHNYQLILHILKVVFLNFLSHKNNENIADKNFNIGINEINCLNKQFPFDQEDLHLKFNVEGDRLIIIENKDKIQQVSIIQNQANVQKQISTIDKSFDQKKDYQSNICEHQIQKPKSIKNKSQIISRKSSLQPSMDFNKRPKQKKQKQQASGCCGMLKRNKS